MSLQGPPQIKLEFPDGIHPLVWIDRKVENLPKVEKIMLIILIENWKVLSRFIPLTGQFWLKI
jgi:hypothetical protein